MIQRAFSMEKLIWPCLEWSKFIFFSSYIWF